MERQPLSPCIVDRLVDGVGLGEVGIRLGVARPLTLANLAAKRERQGGVGVVFQARIGEDLIRLIEVAHGALRVALIAGDEAQQHQRAPLATQVLERLEGAQDVGGDAVGFLHFPLDAQELGIAEPKQREQFFGVGGGFIADQLLGGLKPQGR